MSVPDLEFYRLPDIPLVGSGDDLGRMLSRAIAAAGLTLKQGDILAIAQKIVSKSEGREVKLADVEAGEQAHALARECDKDPRLVQLILDESLRIVRKRPGVIIVEHRNGIVLANAGIDRSNVDGEQDRVLLLPADPDGSARRLREALAAESGVAPGILITDSIGRPWRMGSLGVAIGCSGVLALADLRGRPDLFGRPMETSETSPADALAAAATLAMGEAAEGTPAVLIRGWPATGDDQPASAILRPAAEDLFR
jgi:coenzyme F420-0:L-glutamate ligase/coenzyme F420-1:gamma-L-glutamate ligase